LFKELLILTGLEGRVDYEAPKSKKERLNNYFITVERTFSGEKVNVSIDLLAGELEDMGKWILRHVSKEEWIESKTGFGFFNGYYNNDGQRVDGDQEDSVRMNLTARTFAIMSGAADADQIKKAYESSKEILKDPNTGGFRLTTPLGKNTLNFGRGYAVVYGEKETGGTFNHMVVMFMNALYRRGYIKEAYEVFKTIYENPNNTEKAKIYPGIPEYISHEGRGMYHYLSGSASWLLMTVLTEMYGIKGEFGDLTLRPKLVKEQFDINGKSKANAFFLGKRIQVIYNNPLNLDFEDYNIEAVKVGGKDISYEKLNRTGVKISRRELEEVLKADVNYIEVTLGNR
jgi:hypothetical protein